MRYKPYASFADLWNAVQSSNECQWGWVQEHLYQVYPGGRCIDYTNTRKARSDAL